MLNRHTLRYTFAPHSGKVETLFAVFPSEQS